MVIACSTLTLANARGGGGGEGVGYAVIYACRAQLKGWTMRKVMGGWGGGGLFQLAGIFSLNPV